MLDDARVFLKEHIVANDAALDAMTLYAAATHATKSFQTFPRMLFTSETAASGKTSAMTTTAALCSRPLEATGTSYAVTAMLQEASSTGNLGVPTLYLDEVSSIFGRSGMNNINNPIGDILRKGYKRNATSTVARSGSAIRFSIYTPFLMTGLKTAVPDDIRTRCIVVNMKAGTPKRYYDVRRSEAEAAFLSRSLQSAVHRKTSELSMYVVPKLHDKLVARNAEVWEPLFAVARSLGGTDWVERCLVAFKTMHLGHYDTELLSMSQTIVKDMLQVAEEYGHDFIPGRHLVQGLSQLDSPLYAPLSANDLVYLIRDRAPVSPTRKYFDGSQIRGYALEHLQDVWESIKPRVLMEESIEASSQDPWEDDSLWGSHEYSQSE